MNIFGSFYGNIVSSILKLKNVEKEIIIISGSCIGSCSNERSNCKTGS